jgi:hypothetical protein
VRFRNAGWLLDVNGSAEWEEYETPTLRAPGTQLEQQQLLSEARELAQRYRGGIVRLRRLPDGYRVGGMPAALTGPDDAPEAPEALPEGTWVVAIVSEGWPGSPVLRPHWRLIGPLRLLAAVEAARGRADDPPV